MKKTQYINLYRQNIKEFDLAEPMEIRFGWYLQRFNHYLWLCNERYKQRRRLAQLDDHLLNDINISRIAAQREAQKPCWKS